MDDLVNPDGILGEFDRLGLRLGRRDCAGQRRDRSLDADLNLGTLGGACPSEIGRRSALARSGRVRIRVHGGIARRHRRHRFPFLTDPTAESSFSFTVDLGAVSGGCGSWALVIARPDTRAKAAKRNRPKFLKERIVVRPLFEGCRKSWDSNPAIEG